MRRHGRADGVRLFFSHGNGFTADAYLPNAHLLANFDLVIFDFRNHGQNVPVVPPHHDYKQLTSDLEQVIQAVKMRLGERPTAGLFHSMSARTAMNTLSKSAGVGMRWSYSIPLTCHRLIIRFTLLWRRSRNASSIGRFTGAVASRQ